MLPTRAIPVCDDAPADWHTFLYKASKGSDKAVETLNQANKAYMVAFTGDTTSPESMHLDDYHVLVRQRFPASCPIATIQQFHDIAFNHGWIASAFRVSETPRNHPAEYVALWGRSPVNASELMHDTMLNCLYSWSPDHFIECTAHHGLDYDSRVVTTAMLYLALTWPGT